MRDSGWDGESREGFAISSVGIGGGVATTGDDASYGSVEIPPPVTGIENRISMDIGGLVDPPHRYVGE